MKNKLILILFIATLLVSVLFAMTLYQNSSLQLSRLGYLDSNGTRTIVGNNVKFNIPKQKDQIIIYPTNDKKKVLVVNEQEIVCKNSGKKCSSTDKKALEELVYSSQVNKTIYLKSLEILKIQNNELSKKSSAENNSLISPLTSEEIKMYHNAYALGYRFNSELIINYYDSSGEIKPKEEAEYSEISDIMSVKTKNGNSFIFTNGTVHYIPKACSNDKESTCDDLIISSGSDELRTGTTKLTKRDYVDILEGGKDQEVFEQSIKMIGNSPKKVIKQLIFK